jgi:hypothetical protein
MQSLDVPAFRSLRVFVSHASEDSSRVKQMCHRLSSEGVECWFDRTALKPGEEWEKEIEKAIRRADAVLLLLSAVAVRKRTYLRAEMKLVRRAAESQSRPSTFIIPVKLDDCALPREFARWQAVDLSAPGGTARLLEALRDLARNMASVTVPADLESQGEWKAPKPWDKPGDIMEATRSFESWLRSKTAVVGEHLKLKHNRMRLNPSMFFRSTFYRWAQVCPGECPDTVDAPLVLAAGDTNFEIYGTWLDPEGRVGWGITYFDESYPLPYTSDLIRLAASVRLARKVNLYWAGRSFKKCCRAILESYSSTLSQGGSPFVVGSAHKWLGRAILGNSVNPQMFWARVNKLAPARGIPTDVCEALERALPADVPLRFLTEVGGTGSLGRPRYVGMAQWFGGPVAARARYIPPPSAAWACRNQDRIPCYHNQLLATARRVPELHTGVWKDVFVRRLGPYVSRGLAASIGPDREMDLLRAFAAELANIHLGTAGAQPKIWDDIQRREKNWLAKSAKHMTRILMSDFEQWRSAPV